MHRLLAMTFAVPGLSGCISTSVRCCQPRMCVLHFSLCVLDMMGCFPVWFGGTTL